jgi:ribosome assembly protein RRB1
MSKRAATDGVANDGQPFQKMRASAKDGFSTAKRPSLPAIDDGMGEFEDEWEDDIESDEGVVDRAAEELGGEWSDELFLSSPQLMNLINSIHWDCLDLDLDDEVLPAVEEEDEAPPTESVYLPGSHVLEKDEILEPDQSVYEMLHRMNVTWPCLSFDILRDALGDERRRYPATAYIVAGTQADMAKNNEVIVMKMSQLHKTQRDDGR